MITILQPQSYNLVRLVCTPRLTKRDLLHNDFCLFGHGSVPVLRWTHVTHMCPRLAKQNHLPSDRGKPRPRCQVQAHWGTSSHQRCRDWLRNGQKLNRIIRMPLWWKPSHVSMCGTFVRGSWPESCHLPSFGQDEPDVLSQPGENMWMSFGCHPMDSLPMDKSQSMRVKNSLLGLTNVIRGKTTKIYEKKEILRDQRRNFASNLR